MLNYANKNFNFPPFSNLTKKMTLSKGLVLDSIGSLEHGLFAGRWTWRSDPPKAGPTKAHSPLGHYGLMIQGSTTFQS